MTVGWVVRVAVRERNVSESMRGGLEWALAAAMIDEGGAGKSNEGASRRTEVRSRNWYTTDGCLVERGVRLERAARATFHPSR